MLERRKLMWHSLQWPLNIYKVESLPGLLVLKLIVQSMCHLLCSRYMIVFPLARQRSCCYTGFHLTLIKLFEVAIVRNISAAFINKLLTSQADDNSPQHIWALSYECQQPGLGCSLSYKCRSHAGLQQYYSFSCQRELIPSLQISVSWLRATRVLKKYTFFQEVLPNSTCLERPFPGFFFNLLVVRTLFQPSQEK